MDSLPVTTGMVLPEALFSSEPAALWILTHFFRALTRVVVDSMAATVGLAAVAEMAATKDMAEPYTVMATMGMWGEQVERVVAVLGVVEPEETARCRGTTAMTAAQALPAKDPRQVAPTREEAMAAAITFP